MGASKLRDDPIFDPPTSAPEAGDGTSHVSSQDENTPSPQTQALVWLSMGNVDRPVPPFAQDRYEIGAEIGRGGMGVVFRAVDRQLDRPVALKVLSDEGSTRRFLREARLIARVRSPYVVAVHDIGLLPDRRLALCLDLVEGGNLAQRMRGGPSLLTEDVVVPWMQQTAEAMHSAAALGVIHRDLKPSNILLDEDQRVRVADFGLAFDPALEADLSLTRGLTGTPWYMAPEQAEDPHSIDTRADVYSFGATFYHVLTGKPPFEGPSYFSVLYKHKVEPLKSPQVHNPDLSAWAAGVLERCMAKSPIDRFQSFAEVLREFKKRAEGELNPWAAFWDERMAPYARQYRLRRATYLGNDPLGDEDVYRFHDGRTLTIVRGDLTAQPVEALVSSDDSQLTMGKVRGGGVATAVREAGGEEIYHEAQRYIPVRPGRVVVTSAGKLKSRFVFHGVTLGDGFQLSRDLIAEIVRACCYHAETFSVRSIAFPLLGTGNGGFSREACLDMIFQQLVRALLHGTTPLSDVRIVIR